MRSSLLLRHLPILRFGAFVLASSFVAPLLAPMTVAANALHFVVTSDADAPDADHGDGVCKSAAGKCTLRAALDEANAQAGPAHIEMRPGRYVVNTPLTMIVPIFLQGTQPNAVIVSAGVEFSGLRLLNVQGTDTATWRELQDVTLDGNDRAGVVATGEFVPLRMTRVVVRGGNARDGGGAGIAAMGPLAVLQSSLIDNRLERGGGRGGALLIEDASAWITQTTMTGNLGGNSGGIFARGATVTIEYSSLVGNTGGPVGGYQQNPHSSMYLRGSWLGESKLPSGKRGLDCRSASSAPEALVSGGDNLLAVTGPTGSDLVDGAWRASWEFFCALGGANDRAGSQTAPLEGAWRRVTSPTGIVGVEAAADHPAFRGISPENCLPADAWGRPNPPGQPCDVGALRGGEAGERVSEDPGAAPLGGGGALGWLVLAGAGILVLWAVIAWRRRS